MSKSVHCSPKVDTEIHEVALHSYSYLFREADSFMSKGRTTFSVCEGCYKCKGDVRNEVFAVCSDNEDR